MSFIPSTKLRAVAKSRCRELRKTATNAEKLLWEKLRNRQLYHKKINRQHPDFYDLLGKETFFIADFYCFEEDLIIEFDGPISSITTPRK